MLLAATVRAQPARWTPDAANAWYAKQPWIVGANFLPSNAENQLEMWQADSFDPARIDLELGWAENIGMNSMRVFLHDLLWQQDSAGFTKRIDTFLNIAAKHHIKPILVIFDSVWDPNPKLGKQQDPRPGIHNSRWVQSPGAAALKNPEEYPRLEAYVKGIVGAFANDSRILAWDIWNEPYNVHTKHDYAKLEPPKKRDLVRALLPKAFEWARSANPSQPLTSGLVSAVGPIKADEKLQIDLSDVVSFHAYSNAKKFRQAAVGLETYHRPILCTEYMARTVHSTFEGTMPIAKELHIAVFNWGLVNGRSQTHLPWDSWDKSYAKHGPKIWFHDIFYPDGRPYSQREVDFIRKITRADSAATQP
jgi:hypothetical protein